MTRNLIIPFALREKQKCQVSNVRVKSKLVTFACQRIIEWSLRTFPSMRAVRLFLRAREVINFLMRALRKFSASWNLWE